MNDTFDILNAGELELRAFVNENKKDWDHYGLPVVEIDGQDYAVAFDDDEANAAAHEAIKESLAYFNLEFLSQRTELPVEVLESLAKNNFSDNDATWRGNFLGNYDGEENEVNGAFVYLI
jgi:hypothetical protein